MNINKSELNFYQADAEIIKTINFDSGDKDLNDFLLKDSIKHLNNNLCIIMLCLYEEQVVGFYSLSVDSIKVNKKLEIAYPWYPAIKIGRLAVNKKFQGNGIGTYIIENIIYQAKNLQKDIGIRYLSVDAYNKQEIKKFYYDNDFVKFYQEKYFQTVPMYCDLNTKDYKKSRGEYHG